MNDWTHPAFFLSAAVIMLSIYAYVIMWTLRIVHFLRERRCAMSTKTYKAHVHLMLSLAAQASRGFCEKFAILNHKQKECF